MWTHYLASALRTVTTHRFFSFVNLLGLSIGLASVVAISLYVQQELAHDAWLPDRERLFRVDTDETIPGRDPLDIALAPGPLRDAMQRDFPQVEAATRGFLTPLNLRIGAETFGETSLVADPDFFSVIRLPFVAGSAERALANPASIALSARAAERYFGRRNAIGERLTVFVPEPREFVVAGVFETIPEASHMDFDVVLPLASYFRPSSDGSATIPETWNGAYFHTYVRLRQPSDAAAIDAAFPAFTDRHVPQQLTDRVQVPAHEFYRFRLVPIRDVHFDGATIEAMKPNGSRTTIAALGGVALLILAIAGINFANLTAARAALRSREVALRKVVGARRRQILAQFMVEAAVLTAIAGFAALALVELAMPYLSAWIGNGADLPPPSQWQTWAGLLFLILVTALAAGFYPSWVAASIRPAEAFRRDRIAGGGRLRAALVVFQFTVSVALIAVTLVMAMQNQFARTKDLGFDRENLLIVRVPDGADQEELARALRTNLGRLPDVTGITLSSSVPSDRSEDNIPLTRPDAVRPVSLGYHRVDRDFFAAYRVAPLAGRTDAVRDAAETPDGRQSAAAVVNRSALARLGYARPQDALGEILRSPSLDLTIVGVVPDMHFRSLHEAVRDEIYILDETPGRAITLRHRAADVPAFLREVDRTWSPLVPDRPIVRDFLDDRLNGLYTRERSQAALLSVFAAVAILLSCLGLFAMVAFALQRRTREIALRKVLGARSGDILRLLLWQFSRPVLVATLIAWPVAWWILSQWLNRFAYRIDMPVLAYVAATAIAIGIALAAVSFHTARIAREPPVRSLRDL
jgi:putative ABC transport system permease protein